MTFSKASGQALRIGVVGCGQMGRKHAINCSRMDEVAVTAVSDNDQGRARALAKEIKATPYQSAATLIAEATLDVVIMATPPGERRETVEAAAAAGLAVFVEKPIALDLASAKSLCSAVEKGGVVNAVGFQLRYSPLTQRARALISGKRVTQVRTVTTTSYYLKMDMPPWFLQRRHSGGPLLEQSIHMLDAARYLAGEISHVFAQGDRLVRPELGDFDSEDTAVLAYRFVNGALGTHTDSCAMMEFNWEVELFGPDWRLLVDYAGKRLRGQIGEETICVDMPDSDLHLLEMRSFLDSVRGKKPDGVLSNFVDATRTLAVALAGDRSLRSGAWEPVGQ